MENTAASLAGNYRIAFLSGPVTTAFSREQTPVNETLCNSA